MAATLLLMGHSDQNLSEHEVLRKIGKNIVRLRKERNLNQLELAVMCGFEKTNLSRLELGKINATIRTLLKVCNSLNVQLSDLTEAG